MKKDEKKPAYIICPRCELNYITPKDKYCTVCKAELGLVDPSILLPDDEDSDYRLCPVCHVNYLSEDEEICFLCRKERDEREAEEKKDEWAESDAESSEPIGILPLDDEPLLSEEETEEEEELVHEEEVKDFPTGEDIDEADFYEEDDEDDEEDDDFPDDFPII